MVTKKSSSGKKSSKRDTHIYELNDGKKRVYIGTSKDPKKRAKQHEVKGKKFTSVKVLSAKMKKENAEKKETSLIRKHKKKTGSLPKYNVTESGQYIYPKKKSSKKLIDRLKQVRSKLKKGGKK